MAEEAVIVVGSDGSRGGGSDNVGNGGVVSVVTMLWQRDQRQCGSDDVNSDGGGDIDGGGSVEDSVVYIGGSGGQWQCSGDGVVAATINIHINGGGGIDGTRE